MTNRLAKFLTAGLFLLTLLPLVNFYTLYFPFISGKNFLFRIVTEILFGGWLWLIIREPRYRPKLSGILFSLVLFLAVLGTADALGVNPYRSFWSDQERMDGFITLLHLFVWFLIAGSLLDQQKWLKFFRGTIIVGAVTALWSILRFYWPASEILASDRLQGTLGNAAYFGVYALLQIFLLLLVWYSNPTPKRHRFWLYGAGITIQIAALLLTKSRAAVLGLIGGLLILAILKSITTGKKLWLLILIILVLLPSGLLPIIYLTGEKTGWSSEDSLVARFRSISVENLEKEPRVLAWQVAWRGIRERPWLGWGQENFPAVFNKYYDPRLSLQETWFDHPHNFILEWWLAGGLIGLLAYLALWVSTLCVLWRRPTATNRLPIATKIVLTAMGVAYLINNFFVFDSLTSHFLIFTVLAFIHQTTTAAAGEAAGAGAGGRNSAGQRLKIRFLTPVFTIGTLAIVLVVNGKALAENYYLSAARLLTGDEPASPQEKTGLERRLGLLLTAWEQNSFGRGHIIKELLRESRSRQGPPGQVVAERKKISRLIEGLLETNRHRLPTVFEAKLYLGESFFWQGDYRAAAATFEEASRLAPRRKEPYRWLGAAYTAAGEPEQAVESYKIAYELERWFDASDPDFTFYVDEALRAYVASLIRAGETTQAQTLIRERFDTPYWFHNDIIGAYVAIKDYQAVAAIWREQTIQNPSNVQNWVSLAATYLAMGQREPAINALESAIARNPQAEAELRDLIRRIDDNTLVVKEAK